MEIYFQIFEQVGNWYGGTNEILICSSSIKLKEIPINTIHDLYIDLLPKFRPPNLPINSIFPPIKLHVLFYKSSSSKVRFF